jgi:flagellar biosynthetic protein FliP
MALSDPFLQTLLALLLFTSFIKITTALTVFRYGVGLPGVEFGVVCLVVAFGLSVSVAPPELAKIGFPGVFFGESSKVDPSQVTAALIPYMKQRIDSKVAKGLGVTDVPKDKTESGAASVQEDSAGVSDKSTLQAVAPAFIVSELKSALMIGCLLLIPFVVVDLLVAHLLTLVGIQQLGAQTVALPLKLLLFLGVDGWGLLTKKLLGL